MFKEIYIRLRSKTPIFFKNLQKIFIALGVLGTSITAYGEAMGWIPSWVLPFCLTCGCLGSFLTQLTVEDTSVLK